MPRSGMSVTLSFDGAVGTVTGSSFRLRRGGREVLVDCGMYQGDRQWRQRNWESLPFAAADLDGVVLTHAHLDHCGRLPVLTRAGYREPIWCTPGTARLAPLVLRDSAHLQESYAQAAFTGHFSRHRAPAPLYRSGDADDASKLLAAVDYGIVQNVVDDVTLTFSRAGHILGAATALIDLGGETVLFSGDLGRTNHPVLLPRQPPPAARTVVLESTYGDRTHPPGAETHDILARTVRDTIRRGGSVLIPAFALDRTEIVLRTLSDLTRSGLIPRVPVYVDSPMALAAWEIYRNPQLRSELRADLPSPIGSDLDVRLARTAAESMVLNTPPAPSIVLSASGMGTGGRVVHHLLSMLPRADDAVILTGYQASGTPGRLLAEGAPDLKLYGRYVPVRATIVVDEGFSVHADADELVSWVRAIPAAPEVIYLVHGEDRSREALARRLRQETGWCVVTPSLGETVRLDG